MAKKSKATGLRGQRGTTKGDVQVGIRIRAMRMDRGMSQSELGDALGVSFQQVQKYEKGINRVSAVRLQQIAGILKTSVEQLLGNSGSHPDAFLFDTESYKLAKVLARLPHHLKSRIRSLIAAIIDGEEK